MSKPDKRDFEERYSACFIDFGLKTATGLIVGSMMGSFFLRGFKKWPMYIGGGLGFGMAYMNCENSLNNYLLSMDPKLCKLKLMWGLINVFLMVTTLNTIYQTISTINSEDVGSFQAIPKRSGTFSFPFFVFKGKAREAS